MIGIIESLCLFNRICVDFKQVAGEKINTNRYIVSTDEYGKLWSVDLVEQHMSNRVIVNHALQFIHARVKSHHHKASC